MICCQDWWCTHTLAMKYTHTLAMKYMAFWNKCNFFAYNSSTSNQNARLLLNLNLATQSYTTRITLATTHFISILINGNAIHTPRVASTCMDTLHWILLPVPLPDQYGLVMWSRDESASWSTVLNEEINQLPKSMSTIPTVCYKFVTSN